MPPGARALATAQREEQRALPGRAAEASNEVKFDFSPPANFDALEQEAQGALSAVSAEGKRAMEEALAKCQAQVKAQQVRVEKGRPRGQGHEAQA